MAYEMAVDHIRTRPSRLPGDAQRFRTDRYIRSVVLDPVPNTEIWAPASGQVVWDVQPHGSVVTPDEVVHVQGLGLSIPCQYATPKDPVFGVRHFIWFPSQFMVLEPVDIINTGTPAGVSLGHDDAPFLTRGDVVELGIDGLGRQRSLVGAA